MTIAAAVIVSFVAAAWVALGSSWATVHRIEVTGTGRVAVADVQAAAAGEIGHPLLLARVSQVQAQIAKQPLVRSVTVSRHWPSALRITVVERQPVAAVPVARQLGAPTVAKGARATIDVRLVDPDGVTIATVSPARIPAGIPAFDVDVKAQRGVPALRACLAVSQRLPAAIRSQVTTIGASSPDGVWLRLKSGATVQWGDAGQGELKAQVLRALLKQKASSYDLRSPEAPAVRLT